MPKRLFLFLLVTPGVVLSYDLDRARNNLAHEFAECGAYYQLLAQQPRLDDAMKKRFSEDGTNLVKLSATFTNMNLATARYELALKTMTREMDSDWGNMSIVLNKYAFSCKDLAENPDARLRYWLDKKD